MLSEHALRKIAAQEVRAARDRHTVHFTDINVPEGQQIDVEYLVENWPILDIPVPDRDGYHSTTPEHFATATGKSSSAGEDPVQHHDTPACTSPVTKHSNSRPNSSPPSTTKPAVNDQTRR